MKKLLTVLAAVPLVLGMAACSSDSGSDEPTPAATTAAAEPTEATESPMDDSTESTDGTSAVEAYCTQVDEYVAEAQKAFDDPTSVDAQALQDKAEQLSDTASQLTQELIDDPSQATRVQECTQKLQDVLGN